MEDGGVSTAICPHDALAWHFMPCGFRPSVLDVSGDYHKIGGGGKVSFAPLLVNEHEFALTIDLLLDSIKLIS